MTTMKEIAEQTGVSISTVSLVLNGRDEGRVNPALAKLVRNKATELGYKTVSYTHLTLPTKA